MLKVSNHRPRECKQSKSSVEIGFVSYMQLEGQSDPHGWVCSTGATVHVCNSRDKFTVYSPVSGKHVSLIDGSKVNVAGIGSVILTFTSGKKVTLPAVAHIPSFVTNFLSVGRITRNQGFAVTFDSGTTMIYKNKMFVGNGCVRDGVYMLNVENDHQSGTEE